MISLQDRKWKPFKIIDILGYSKNSNSYHKKDLNFIDGNGLAYVSRKCKDNGLSGIVSNNGNYVINPKNSISFGAENAAYYFQPFEYITGNKMYYYCNNNLSIEVLKFLTICLNHSLNSGYGFGHGLTGTRSNRRQFLLPVNRYEKPDYEFMEKYIQEKESKYKNGYKTYIEKSIVKFKVVELKKEWKEFFISEIFKNIQRGKRLIKEHQKEGNMPYVSSSALNNGVDNFIGNDVGIRKYSNCLSLANSGSVGACFYEPYEFVASDHVTHLKGNYSKYVYLFMSCMLNRLSEKYNFNREINDDRIRREKVFLPVNSNGEPDYKFMEDYMKYLEQKKLLEYLDYIK